MVLSGGRIWAEGRRQEDEETMFYPEELLVHTSIY
jgi:hypothetical protein